MLSLIRKKFSISFSLKTVFRNEQGAIDLASIMVGILVIGLIGGVIAATVFAVIPWTQDKAAKQQLDSIAAAQSAYRGLSSSGALPEPHTPNSYGNSLELAEANLMPLGEKYCSIKTDGGKGYKALVQSANKKVFQISDTNTNPTQVTGMDVLPADCVIPTSTVPEPTTPTIPEPTTPTPAPVDKTRLQTSLTFKCDTDTIGSLPVRTNIKGTEKWSDGVTNEYNSADRTTPRTLKAGVEYQATFEGTYELFSSATEIDYDKLIVIASYFAPCITSLDTWGEDTGVKSATGAFYGATKLTSVPKNLPSTVTNLSIAFTSALSFNDASIKEWDVSRVTDMRGLFAYNTKFSQPLNSWNVGNVTDMATMFSTTSYNQPLDNWNVSKVTTMQFMFAYNPAFNQPLNTWNVSSVQDMSYVFYQASAFNQPLNNWNTSNVTTMLQMFSQASSFNQTLDKWDVSKVTTMQAMFLQASKFSQNLSGWKTTSLTGSMAGQNFAPASFPSSYLPAKTIKSTI